jgi:hypothetical protein
VPERITKAAGSHSVTGADRFESSYRAFASVLNARSPITGSVPTEIQQGCDPIVGGMDKGLKWTLCAEVWPHGIALDIDLTVRRLCTPTKGRTGETRLCGATPVMAIRSITSPGRTGQALHSVCADQQGNLTPSALICLFTAIAVRLLSEDCLAYQPPIGGDSLRILGRRPLVRPPAGSAFGNLRTVPPGYPPR